MSWEAIEGEFPTPGVVLQMLKQETQETQFSKEDDNKYSPFEFISANFKISKPLGIKFKMSNDTSKMVVVASVEPNSQASANEIQIG